MDSFCLLRLIFTVWFIFLSYIFFVCDRFQNTYLDKDRHYTCGTNNVYPFESLVWYIEHIFFSQRALFTVEGICEIKCLSTSLAKFPWKGSGFGPAEYEEPPDAWHIISSSISTFWNAKWSSLLPPFSFLYKIKLLYTVMSI